MGKESCPDKDVLRRVVNSEATPEEVEHVIRHLESCESCQKALEEAGVEPEKVEELREAHKRLAESEKETIEMTSVRKDPAPRIEGDHVVLPNGVRLERPRDKRYIGYLDGYDIERVLGAGAMGVVLKAYQESLNRKVAIKVMNPTLAQEAVARRRFLDEAKHMAEIRHQNIVTIYAVSPSADTPYLVMEYVTGKSLAMLIEEEAPLAPERAARIARQILAGLGHAHAKRKVHRDIKPSNVLLENHLEAVKIADFGLAVAVGQVVRRTEEGQVVGTPAYMSPEQAAGQFDLDARTDLFAVGSILYEMLTGVSPFQANNAAETMRKVREVDPPPLRSLNPDVSQELSRIVARAMEKDFNKRYQTADEFEAELNALLGDRRRPGLLEVWKRWRAKRLRKDRGRSFSVAVNVALLLVVTIILAVYVATTITKIGTLRKPETKSSTPHPSGKGRLTPATQPAVIGIVPNTSNTQTVLVTNSNGSVTPVTLRRVGSRWIGPRGEEWLSLPTGARLRPIYGF